MYKLIQTEDVSIVYGDFKGEQNQELFRCPRACDATDLNRYVSQHRCMLGFEADSPVKDLRKVKNYAGYYRMYFANNMWCGTWLEYSKKIDEVCCIGINGIIRWLRKNFPKGCDWSMKEYLSKYPTWQGENRYLLKPMYSDHYKVVFDTSYGNEDYPVRIYVYEE